MTSFDLVLNLTLKEWEQIDMEIDGNLERIYQNCRTGYKTRTDPRISIKTHLEDLHVSLTAEMISRINNPTAFNQVCKNIMRYSYVTVIT